MTPAGSVTPEGARTTPARVRSPAPRARRPSYWRGSPPTDGQASPCTCRLTPHSPARLVPGRTTTRSEPATSVTMPPCASLRTGSSAFSTAASRLARTTTRTQPGPTAEPTPTPSLLDKTRHGMSAKRDYRRPEHLEHPHSGDAALRDHRPVHLLRRSAVGPRAAAGEATPGRPELARTHRPTHPSGSGHHVVVTPGHPAHPVAGQALTSGQAAHRRRAWRQAAEALPTADAGDRLGPDDLATLRPGRGRVRRGDRPAVRGQ